MTDDCQARAAVQVIYKLICLFIPSRVSSRGYKIGPVCLCVCVSVCYSALSWSNHLR